MKGAIIHVDNKTYKVVTPKLVVTSSGKYTKYDAGAVKHVNVCEHCHRGDIVPDIATTWAEVIQRGWVNEVIQ